MLFLQDSRDPVAVPSKGFSKRGGGAELAENVAYMQCIYLSEYARDGGKGTCHTMSSFVVIV